MAIALPAGVAPDRGTDSESPARKPAQGAYFPLFDLLRFAAAVGIIWIHATLDVPSPRAHDSAWLARSAVPFFTCGAVLFAITSWARNPERRFGSYLLSRILRLYVPFLVWSAIYLALKHKSHDPSRVNPGWRVLWDGGAYHLWFLPFILVVTVAFAPLAGLMRRRETAVALGVAAVLAGCLIALLPSPFRYMAGRADILYLGWRALPASLWAIPLAALALSRRADELRSRAVAATGAALAIGCTFALLFAGPHPLLQNAAGFGLVLVGLCACDASTPLFARLAKLGKLAMGVYLVHLLFIGACRSLAARHGGSATLGFAAWATVVALVCSAAVTWLLLRVKWLRWLVV